MVIPKQSYIYKILKFGLDDSLSKAKPRRRMRKLAPHRFYVYLFKYIYLSISI